MNATRLTGRHISVEVPDPSGSDPALGEREAPRSGDPVGGTFLIVRSDGIVETTIGAETVAGPPPLERLTNVGRGELIDRIEELDRQNRELRNQVSSLECAVSDAMANQSKVIAESRVMLANLGAVQDRCTELLNTERIAKFLEDKPELMASLLDVAWGVERARKLHPEGCCLTDLVAEVGEVANASIRETDRRIVEELRDVAIVAIRLSLGERRVSG